MSASRLSRGARVCRATWLYTRPDLRAEIERLRATHADRSGLSVSAPELALAYGRQRETRASAGQPG